MRDENVEGDSGPRIVSVGGRSSALLAIDATDGLSCRLTCVVEVTDSGSSTGIIRRHFGVPAPGDIRSALARLADPGEHIAPLRDLIEYRFRAQPGSDLDGMAFGNILLAGLTLQLGDFHQAVLTMGKILGVRGSVLPIANENIRLCAELDDGTIVRGEYEVRVPGKPPIRRLFLDGPEAALLPDARAAIVDADLILLGPGAFYTSLLPCLIVPGVPEALAESGATRVLLANNTTTLGQTEHMTFGDQMRTVLEIIGPRALDIVLVNTGRPPEEMLRAYNEIGLEWIAPAEEEIAWLKGLDIEVLQRDVTERDWSGVRSLHKVDTIRHDPSKLGEIIESLLTGNGSRE
jgi:uncharacterized cofD-like protein